MTTETVNPIVAPALIIHPHALLGDGTTMEYDPFRPGETLGRYVERTGAVLPRQEVAVWHNGVRCPDALWRRLIPRNGDQVVIRARMLGPGGDSSKVLRTVAMLALVAAAPWAATQLGFAAGTIGYVGTVSVLTVGGAALVTPLLPEITG